jgi:acetoin:2,6-dichlorophenolindophenol oxidoreductase subunit alpha
MPANLWSLYGLELKSRLFELAVAKFWYDGQISGEMHLGTGEEAVNAGVVSQLCAGDAMALDHRSTAPLLMRGLDPVLILREMLGNPDGLCGGMGGHMHLFSKENLSASSGIVGAAGPTAVGFAIAAQYLRPGTIAVAFFGEGAMNQGMLMESLNLAAAWNLPVLFICKDDGWSITTRSVKMTGGDLNDRARGLGIPAVDVDGCDVSSVWEAARLAIERSRNGGGPGFLHAHCVHIEGHLLGYQPLRVKHDPLRETPAIALPLTQAFFHPGGAAFAERIAGLKAIMTSLLSILRDPGRDKSHDPVSSLRRKLRTDPERLQDIEDKVEREMGIVLECALAEAPA